MSEPGTAGPEDQVLTSDNLLLSEPSAAVLAGAGQSTLDAISNDPRLRKFVDAAHAPNTLRAYKSDLEHFRAWGGPAPCDAITVARYLADHAATLRASTLARRLAAIAAEHRFQGFPDPCKAEIVRLTFRGIRRTFGHRQRRVSALTMEKMKRVLKVMDRSARDTRDKALLLIGFAGAFRRSELCAIRFDWIARTGTGIRITLPQSKTDQERIGRSVTITASRCAMCPVAALDYWFEVVKVNKGPVFRVIDRAGRILSSQLSPEAVARIVKGRTAAVGLDSGEFSGQSLRAGFVTSAIAAGLSTFKIRSQTGHRSDAMLSRYFRDDEFDGDCSAATNSVE